MRFMDDNVLLESDTARGLYAACRDLPIIDYHSHLPPAEIAGNRHFSDLAELWLSGDHYKWRLMRACGVPESLVTGDGAAKDKFRAFAGAVGLAPGNPVTVWSQFELKTYFGLAEPLTADSADGIFDRTAQALAGEGYRARDFIRRSGVEVVCTTDDPADDLACHDAIAAEHPPFSVLPSFRPDKALNIEKSGFAGYMNTLGADSLDALKHRLIERLDYFCARGCRVTDCALDKYTYAPVSEKTAARILAAALSGEKISALQAENYRTHMLLFLAREYHKRGLVMQLHFNCRRNVNTAAFARFGPDSGYDTADVSPDIAKLAMFLDALGDELPKTVVYSLNPYDDKLIDTVIGAFQRGCGYLQHGSAWWFNDTYYGIRSHLTTLCEYGALGTFIGMLTDSRSFSSYVRHDYFRRILSGVVAEEVDRGLFPRAAAEQVVRDVSYYNVKKYLGL